MSNPNVWIQPAAGQEARTNWYTLTEGVTLEKLIEKLREIPESRKEKIRKELEERKKKLEEDLKRIEEKNKEKIEKELEEIKEELEELNNPDLLIEKIKNNLEDDGRLYLWGLTPGRANTSNWERMCSGDYVLFYLGVKDGFNYPSRIKSKIRRKLLAEILWGEDSTGQTWKLVYFLEKPSVLSESEAWTLDEYREGCGYDGVPRGLMRVANALRG